MVGNRRVEPETVRSYLKFNIGDAYDAGKVDESLKALFATGLFSDVRIDREAAGVLITVVENPVIDQVAFEGNREVDKATLEGEVQLKPRSVFTRSRAQADVQRILDVYRRQGRFAAAVEPKLIELDSNRVNLVFEVNEGGATKVKAINFIGNRAFSDSQLRDIITTTQSGLFDFLKGTNIYDPDRLSLDRELLRQYYLKNGYADARVVSAGAELDRDGSGFFITFVIDEGEVFKFGSINLELAVAGVDTQGLQRELLTYSGRTFDQSQMDKTVERLTLVVSERGVAFARVRPRAARDAAARLINVTYVVDEGPRIYIERINIIGNYAHARLRDQARIPPGGRRCLQPVHGRQGKEAPAAARLLQDGRDQAPAWLGTRPGDPRCRAPRAINRRAVVRRGLFDQRGRDRRRLDLRAQPARTRPIPALAPGRLPGAHARST